MQFWNLSSSQWMHVCSPAFPLKSSREFSRLRVCNETGGFFFSDASPRVDGSHHYWQMAPRYAILYSKRTKKPSHSFEHSNRLATDSRNDAGWWDAARLSRLILFTVSTVRAFFCRAVKKSRDKKKKDPRWIFLVPCCNRHRTDRVGRAQRKRSFAYSQSR